MNNVISIITRRPIEPTPEVFTKFKTPPVTENDKFIIATMNFFFAPEKGEFNGASYTDMEKADMLLKESHELLGEAYELYLEAMELMKVKS